MAKGQIDANEIGKIDISDHYALAAVPATVARTLLNRISKEKVKNKRIKISIVKQNPTSL